jgi:hypothetical protein
MEHVNNQNVASVTSLVQLVKELVFIVLSVQETEYLTN